MLPHRIWRRRLLAAALVIGACHQIWRHGQDYVFIDKFAEVVPGRIYRGAWQQDWPMHRLVRNYKIKTVVALAHPPESPLAVKEKALANELGFRWIHIPIVDHRISGVSQPLLDSLERAANALASSKNQPVYFHCHHGVNRTSMVQIAYRTLHCGWTLEQATEEISRDFGLKEVAHGPDYRQMAAFYNERVLPRRQARLNQRESNGLSLNAAISGN
ncbi:tyrosine-protein phosphatase [Singulisphaera acidiphila]|uniref:Protein tyrosine/serine phosphatase n=1 Tax=Singulisphaera acidiphila (strain ATCC BAA-1392 / DSM 18658 / VKM B-2454 / MOB10) TaxID=886293 RepID=L0DN67_SINAD|nr:tyrosine-protein phosphatase [Singulisphaera acidiphila]AGA30283.1 protein tyrosine/serine phosphatase [Singulisphaera acidiphila DSM 18658]